MTRGESHAVAGDRRTEDRPISNAVRLGARLGAILLVLCTVRSAMAQSLENGLVSYWTLDPTEIDGDTVKDLIGNNHGTFVGAPVPVDGIIGGALELNGFDDAVDIPHPEDGSFDFGQDIDFSISAWVQPFHDLDQVTIVSKNDGGGNPRILFKLFPQGFVHFTFATRDGGANGPVLTSVEGTIVDEWNHVALVADRDEATSVYVNGVLDTDGIPSDDTDVTSDSPLWIGASIRTSGDTRRFLEGLIDDVAIWNRALDETELAEIYQRGRAGMGIVDGLTRLQAGDADQDLDFDQLDLVQAQIAAKYLTGEAATWGEGDWDGAPGGEPGNPPQGNGRFDQLDIIAALGAGLYLQGPYAAIAGGGQLDDDQTSVVYNPSTGEVSVDAPSGHELTSINIDSAAGIFTGDPAQNLGGSFDNDADGNIFKATFGSSFGSLSFGPVAQPGLDMEFVRNDLTVVGSLAGGGDLGEVDLVYVPEPSAIVLLLGMGVAGALRRPRRRKCATSKQVRWEDSSHTCGSAIRCEGLWPPIEWFKSECVVICSRFRGLMMSIVRLRPNHMTPSKTGRVPGVPDRYRWTERVQEASGPSAFLLSSSDLAPLVRPAACDSAAPVADRDDRSFLQRRALESGF